VELLVGITLWVLGGFLVGQIFFAARFVLVLRRYQRELLPDELCPMAVVVLCLRGSDPFLSRCLSAIIAQDYPRFFVKVIVDHRADPAWSLVEQAIRDHPSCPLEVEPRTKHLETCSLKCSSLVQAVESLEADYEFVAQLDADTIPHRSWLRELATALAEQNVGAASGNRWYMPEDSGWASMVRSIWNAAAVIQMFWYKIAWGGTLAIKTQVIREAGLLDHWSHALCEDTMLFSKLRRHGWRVAFVPSLMMVNRESCDFSGFLPWCRRQLVTARLYHPGWPAVVAHGLGTTVTLAGAVLLAGIAGMRGNHALVAWLALGLVIYQLGAMLLLAPVEWSVRRIMAARHDQVRPWDAAIMVRQVLALFVTQIIYPVVLTAAAVARSVRWRQATYQINGPWKIRLVSEKPYMSDANETTSRASL
jgi:GT2 family glycosyltransferase